MKFNFKCIKRSRFEKHFSPDFLEFTLIFTYFLIFSNFRKLAYSVRVHDGTDARAHDRITFPVSN
jgi:hypothetical protein